MSIKNGNFLSLIVSILNILELSLVYTLVNRQRVVFFIGQRVKNSNHYPDFQFFIPSFLV